MSSYISSYGRHRSIGVLTRHLLAAGGGATLTGERVSFFGELLASTRRQIDRFIWSPCVSHTLCVHLGFGVLGSLPTSVVTYKLMYCTAISEGISKSQINFSIAKSPAEQISESKTASDLKPFRYKIACGEIAHCNGHASVISTLVLLD
eukprot:1934627-Amphidinium_carterae.2